MNFYILITYLPICLISFSLALFILFKGSKTRIEFLISTTLLSLSFWVFSLTIGDFSKNYKLALFWVNTAMLGPAILLGSMYLLLNAIIKSDKFLPKLFIILILAAPFFLLCYTPFNAKSIELHYWGSAVNPGILYDYFNVYALIIFFLGLFNLKNYKSFSENIKIIVKIMGIGFCVGVGTALITNNLLLVIFNISQLSIVGPFCALLVTVIIFLGLVKYELTDIQFVISKFLARMIIIFLILFTIISSFYIPGSKNISLILICFWGIFWGVSGKNLQEKFQTYARRKFIKGYYNTDALLRTISEQLSLEKNREEIFKVLEHELDEAIQLEKIGFIIALRDKDGHLASYAYYEKISLESTEYNIVNLKLNHPLIANLAKRDNLVELRDLDIANQKMVINQLGFNKNTFFMSFTSPEMLEGILVLGERSGGIAYSLRDLDFLKLIINTVNSLLYRLTPYEELEKSFTENKQKLHNAELAILQAKKEEADCANAYKSLFLAQMTHDLRTPLYVVIGVLDMLTRAEKVRQDGLGLQKPLDLALVSAQRQLNLVNTILDLSKIESGKMEVHIESFALNDLCEGLLEQMQTLLKEKTVKFIIENNLLAEDLIIKADKTSLQQVITNLLSNAAKFTTEGEIRLRITKEEGKLYFEVRDTGIGLSQENINRLFTSYTQIENELQKKYKGTGLGLSICKGLVEAHKGEIVVESEEGKGTAFIFWIPYLVGKRQEKPDAEAVKESMAKILAKIKNKTILMVDDDEFNLAYAQMILEGKINYDLASGGKDAIIKAKQKKYDVVFLDLNMPEMDGKGAYNEIRAFDKITPIIALTAAAMKGTKEELEQFGFSGYLSKPFKEDDLLGFIYLKVG